MTPVALLMVKPLGRQLKGVSAFAGATIMGDGKVALILDPVGLAQRGVNQGDVIWMDAFLCRRRMQLCQYLSGFIPLTYGSEYIG